MSTSLEQAGEGLLARYQSLAASLPGAAGPRERAASSFRKHGLPDTHVEAWRFTDLRPLSSLTFAVIAPTEEQTRRILAATPVAASAAALLVFANGRFFPGLSRIPSNLEIASFAQHPAFTEADGVSAPEALVTLNTMFAEDGALITVPKGVDGGTLVLLDASLGGETASNTAAAHPRHHLTLGRGARLTFVEVEAGEGFYLHNPVTEITLGENSQLLHLRVQNESATAIHLGQVNTRLERDAHYHGFTLSIGAHLARTEIHVELTGTGSAADLDAAQLLAGQQHADITTIVRHVAPNAESRQTVKNVLTGRSHAVFQGRISVVPEAQKTDAYQRNETLLLSPTAQVNSKPELEIFADDVKCSHGATVGALDANQLFYLQSRGVPLAEARAMLVRGFFIELFAKIPDDAARGLLEQASDAWWKNRSL